MIYVALLLCKVHTLVLARGFTSHFYIYLVTLFWFVVLKDETTFEHVVHCLVLLAILASKNISLFASKLVPLERYGKWNAQVLSTLRGATVSQGLTSTCIVHVDCRTLGAIIYHSKLLEIILFLWWVETISFNINPNFTFKEHSQLLSFKGDSQLLRVPD